MAVIDKKIEEVPTLCRLCIAHCGVLASVKNDNGIRKLIKVTGDPVILFLKAILRRDGH